MITPPHHNNWPRSSIPSIYAQRLLMGPKCNGATDREEFSCTTNIPYEQTFSEEGQSAKQTWPRHPNPNPLPPCEARKSHPFLQYMPKGSSWVPNAMVQQTEKNSAAQQTSHTSKHSPKRAKVPSKPGPGTQIRTLCPRAKHAKAIHSFNICPKAPHGSQMQWCNRQRRIQLHNKHPIRANILRRGPKCQANLAQAPKSEPFAPVRSTQKPSIPSIYAQRLLMGPKCNGAT